MQLGMIGLGRMGGNIVRRLMRDGHEFEVYDVNADAITELEGEAAVGVLVFACSVVVPVLKILGILWLSWRREWGSAAARVRAHRIIEWAGRWSMLDVLLVAILVAAIKLGNWADIQAGPGVFAFAGVVVMSLMASALFDVRELEAEL